MPFWLSLSDISSSHQVVDIQTQKNLSGSEGDLFPTQFFDFFDLDLRYFERYRVGVFVESGEERPSLFADLRQACFLFVGCNISRQGNKTQQEKC